MENGNAHRPEVVDDIAACHREGRRPRDGAVYRVLVGDDQLAYKPVDLTDPVPTGRQIVEALGFHPADEFVVLNVRKDGPTDELGVDVTVDLRDPAVEKFLVFRSAEIFRLEIDGRVFDWGAPAITGLVLKKLAGVDPVKFSVWQEVRGGADQKIGNEAAADLTPKGLERFFTGVAQTTEG